jgi:hypothetical protein
MPANPDYRQLATEADRVVKQYRHVSIPDDALAEGGRVQKGRTRARSHPGR